MSIKILIVDDEADARFLCSEILSDLYETEEAENVAQALEKIESFSPHIVLSDIKMPGEDGISLLKKVKKSHPEIYVALLTGHGDKQLAIEAIRSGAFDFIEKPFEDEEILSTVERMATVIELHQKLEMAKLRTAESEKMASLGLMSGGIAHEINTPLGAILLTAQAIERGLKKESPDLEKASKMAGKIQMMVDNISQIIQSLKAFSRDSQGDAFEESNLMDIVQNTISLCKNKIKISNVEVRMDEGLKNVPVPCRPSEIIQVLVNLVNNACDAIQDLEEKWIELKVEESADTVKLILKDSGGGIPQDALEKIFDPFYTTKDIDKGTGLGLYVCSGLVKGHGGSLEIDSSSKNTTFVLSLPKSHESDIPLAA